MLTTGSTVVVTKGCAARNVKKGQHGHVVSVRPMGPDYSHVVQVVFLIAGRVVTFYARHRNRLADAQVAMNDGNPLHRIAVRVVSQTGR